MKIGMVAVALSVMLLLLAACGKTAQPVQEPMQKAPEVQIPPAAATAPTADAEINDIETTSAQIDQLDEEFDTSELDSLEADLAALDGLDFG